MKISIEKIIEETSGKQYKSRKVRKNTSESLPLTGNTGDELEKTSSIWPSDIR